MSRFPKKIISVLKKGGVGVVPTDTIYGIVARARDPKAVARVYRIRARNPKKPCIILIGAMRDLSLFDIQITSPMRKILRRAWPGKVSVILRCPHKKFRHLHRGTKTLAFRLPAGEKWRTLLRSTGPLIAPSANHEGEPPATTIGEAKKYFGDQVDFYVSAPRRLLGKPSKILRIEKDKEVIMRP